MKRLYLLHLAISFAVNGYSQACFTSPVSALSDSMPICICTADLNGDGYIDAAVGNGSSPSISVFLGSGNGSFGSPSHITVTGLEPQDIISADFNGDGIADIATANSYSLESVSVLLGTGTGSFSAPIGLSGGSWGYYWAVTSADLNGDGLLDIITSGGSMVVVFLNLGAGNFGTAAHFSNGIYGNEMISADFNNDGALDIATSDTGGVSVLLGTGAGGLGSFVHYQTLENPWPPNKHGLVARDFNGDGNIDMAVPNFWANTIAILSGDGTGGFAVSATYSTLATAPQMIVCEDFDGDCNVDLAVEMNDLSQSVEIFTGNGNGTFNSPISFPVMHAPVSICAADLDGDFKHDLIFPATQRIKRLLNCISDQCSTVVGTSKTIQPLSLYPNPAQNKLNLKVDPSLRAAQVRIENMWGEIVRIVSSEVIDLSDLSSGCYFVRLTDVAGSVYVRKFIKE